jgi:hypothetical protein
VTHHSVPPEQSSPRVRIHGGDVVALGHDLGMAKRAGRKKPRRRGRTPPRAAAPALPSGFVRGLDHASTALAELQHSTPEAAIERRRAELQALIAPFDAVVLLGQLVLSEMPLDPDSYSESEHPGVAFVVEAVAAELLTRPSRSGTAEHSPAFDRRTGDPLRRLVHEAVWVESMARVGRAAELGGGPEEIARGRAATQHLMLRGPGWPWQEYEALRGLFGPKHLATRLRERLGFDAEDAIACADCLGHLILPRAHEHMRAAVAEAPANNAHPAHAWADAVFTNWKDVPHERGSEYMAAIWGMNHAGDAMLVDADTLAECAGVTRSAAAHYLDALAIPFAQPPGDWFAAAERVRWRPFVDVSDGQYLLTVPGNDLWALRGLFEAALADGQAYQKHRATWLERRAATLLAEALHPDEHHTDVAFSYRDDDGVERHGQIDALLRLGDTALVVEAKGASLRPSARRGGQALIDHLRKHLRKAAEQGTAARAALGSGEGSLTKDGAPVTMGETIREVHPVVVTLDDLSAVAPVIWQLQGSRVMPSDVTTPWIVTLHELEHVCRTVEWPVQFVHFLRRRSRLNQIGHLIASDELDWWMLYLNQGLYFDGSNLPEGPVRVLSHTDPLDAWMLYDKGLRERPAPKPTMRLHDGPRRFLDLLCSERPTAWIAAGCTLLDMNGAARKRLWKDAKRLRRRARERELVQRATYGFEDAPEPILVCWIVVPDDDAEHVGEHLVRCVDERITEHGEQRALGIGSVVSSERPYDALVVVEKRRWEPPAAPRRSQPEASS